MHIILYARVFTGTQAELSIPAQLRLMRKHAENQGWIVGGEYQDTHTGTSPDGRPGLMAALRHAHSDKIVGGLLVHKLDRLSRNAFNYLILKGKLRSYGKRIFSVIETIEDNLMGEFLEHDLPPPKI